MRRWMRPRRAMAWACATSACALLAGACSDSDSPSSASTTTETTETLPVAEVEDGELQLGVLLPLTGAGAEIGTSMRDAIELAVAEINAAGGVSRRDIRLFVEDESDDAITAISALNELMNGGVDAIVGPASSLIAPQVLPITIAGRVLTCSPSASALSLDGYPDDGLFVRTIPSDSLQAVAIASAIEQTGKPTAALAYIDDAFGRPFAELVSNELDERGINVLTSVGYDPTDNDYSAVARSVLSPGANVVAVIGDSGAGPRIVQALFDGTDAEVEIIINDAMRIPDTASAYASLSDDDRALLSGVSPQSGLAPESFRARFEARYPGSRGLYASYAYDCVNLIALAANASNSTRASIIAQRIPSVAAVGTPCNDFAQCDADLSAERNINYEGASGAFQINTNGDLARGAFDVFTFDKDGRDIFESPMTVSG